MSPKLRKVARFLDHPKRPYFFLVDGAHDQQTVEELSFYPGVHTATNVGKDLLGIPAELDLVVATDLKEAGYALRDDRTTRGPKAAKLTNVVKKAHPYQRSGASYAAGWKRIMLAYEPGLGKTLTTILALRSVQPSKVLVVCPAIVRLVWADQLAEWWPKGPDVYVVDTGKAVAGGVDAPIQSVSYELAPKLPKKGYDFIIVDESHYVAKSKAKRSRAVRAILDQNPEAHVVFLTGTPITNEPIGLWHQLECLWPGRFGTYWDFAYRYCEVDVTDYTDYWVHGINAAHIAELERRLGQCMHRVTKEEVEHLLPPFVVTPIRIRSNRSFQARETFEELSRMDFHNEKASDALIRACGSQKVKAASDFAEDRVGSGQKIAVLTWLKSTAHNIEARLRKAGVPVWRFDGDTPIKNRDTIIRTCLKHPEAGVVVCTMASVKEGINVMAGFDHALLAELYYTPGMMVQVINRFYRVNKACDVSILYVEGTHEEIIAMRLQEKMDNAARVIKAAKSAKAMSAAFDQLDDEIAEDEFEHLREVACSRVEEDAYA